MMKLRELRMFRSLQPAHVNMLKICEWTATERMVKDFECYQDKAAEGPRVVAASIGPDPKATKSGDSWSFWRKKCAMSRWWRDLEKLHGMNWQSEAQQMGGK